MPQTLAAKAGAKLEALTYYILGTSGGMKIGATMPTFVLIVGQEDPCTPAYPCIEMI